MGEASKEKEKVKKTKQNKTKQTKKTVCLSPVYHSQDHCNNRLLPFEVKTLGLKETVIHDYDIPRFLR